MQSPEVKKLTFSLTKVIFFLNLTKLVLLPQPNQVDLFLKPNWVLFILKKTGAENVLHRFAGHS